MFDKIVKIKLLPARKARLVSGNLVVVDRAKITYYDSGISSTLDPQTKLLKPYGKKKLTSKEAERAVRDLNFLYENILPRRKKSRTKKYPFAFAKG